MAPVLTPKSETKPVAYRGPAELVAQIDAAAKALGLSRNEAMTQLLRAGLQAHLQEAAEKEAADLEALAALGKRRR